MGISRIFRRRVWVWGLCIWRGRAWVSRWVGGITNEITAALAFGTSWDTQC
jgi:hypothetical protein